MSGLNLLTRHSTRNASEASIFLSESLESFAVEHGWSWKHLKRQIERKDATAIYEKYRQRIHHSMFIVALMLNMSFCLLLFFLYITSAKKLEDVKILTTIRVLGFGTNLVVFVASYREEWFRGWRCRVAASCLVLGAMMASEQTYSIVVLALESENPHQDIRLTFYVVLVTFVFLPFPTLLQTVLAASAAIVVELGISIVSYRNSDFQLWKIMMANIVFYMVIVAVGFYLKYLLELTNRRAFLESVSCFESKCNLDLQKEQEEQLLLSILPKHISSQVKEDLRSVILNLDRAPNEKPFEHLYVEKHKDVTILYADIVNSMLLTANLDGNELVETLNELFSKFDEYTEKNRCLRIKLLGDCYYCVSGVPTHDPTHADNCVKMGLEMINVIRQVREERQINVDMRIGIHSGNVMSGILGLRKWQYDIWSHDVTVASHMERFGKPGLIHITKATKDRLKESYNIKKSPSPPEDELLANIETYFIIPPHHNPTSTIDGRANAGESRNYYRAKRQSASAAAISHMGAQIQKKRSSLNIPVKRRRTILDDSIMNFRKMMTNVSQLMLTSVDAMPLSKTDQWFRSPSIQPFLLTFRRGKLEVQYFLEPDPLFKYYILAILFLFFGMLAIHFLTMARTYYIMAVYVAAFLILLIIVHFLWMEVLIEKFRREESSTTKGRYRKLIAKSAGVIMTNVGVRVALFFLVCTSMLGSAMLGLEQCIHNYGNNTSSSTLDFRQSSLSCEYPWYYTYCGVVAMATATVFLRIHLYLKLVTNLSALVAFSLLITRGERTIFSAGKLHFGDLHDFSTISPLFGHVWFLLVAFITFHTLDRQVEYLSKLDYIWKQQLNEEREESFIMGMINHTLLQNILPTHVAYYYLNRKSQGESLYHEEYSSVAVMFASIPNYNDFYTENISNDDGMRCIQILNEIICDFDKLLLQKSFYKIEKIKTIGSTYMAAAGLQPGRHSSSATYQYLLNEDHEEDPSANTMLLFNFALKMMETLEQLNQHVWQDFKLRIGMDVGPVVAGVVGAVKPQYDIWGDTVNMASRMDSTGHPERIQVTKAVADILKANRRRVKSRGEIFVKGKGHVETFFALTNEEIHLETLGDEHDTTRL